MAGTLAKIERIVRGITIPKGQKNRGDDYVMWRQEGPKPRDWGSNTACFGGSMRNGYLTTHRFECRSFLPGRHLPSQIYLGSMKELRRVGLVPPRAGCWIHDKSARFSIPADTYDRHTIFSALSLYRHCDAQSGTMFLAWQLFQKLHNFNIPYLQCLHYALGKLGHNGHTFISMSGYDGAGGGMNPAYGWAMAYFGTLDFEARAKLEPVEMTTHMYCALADRVNPVYPSHSYPSTVKGIGTPVFRVAEAKKLLLPQLSPLYTNPLDYQTPAAFSELVKGICDDTTASARSASTPRWAGIRKGIMHRAPKL